MAAAAPELVAVIAGRAGAKELAQLLRTPEGRRKIANLVRSALDRVGDSVTRVRGALGRGAEAKDARRLLLRDIGIAVTRAGAKIPETTRQLLVFVAKIAWNYIRR